MKQAPFVILFAAMIFLLTRAGWADDVRWRVTRTKHFIVYYAAGRESTAERAGVVAEKWHAILSGKLKFSPRIIVPVYLYPDRRSFAEALDIEPGEMIVGIAHTRTYRVRIDASGAFADIARVIPHELVHVFVSHRLRGYAARLPLWMHEGLAKYLADDWSGQDAELLADVAGGGEILRLQDIAAVFPTDERKRSIAYIQSYSIVKYMAERFSSQSILDLFSELENGHSIDVALFYSIGLTPREFEDEWRQYLWEEYRLGRWIKLGSALVSVAMGILAILAFHARRIQKRRRMEFMDRDVEWTVDDE